jgi:hypothetical protein
MTLPTNVVALHAATPRSREEAEHAYRETCCWFLKEAFDGAPPDVLRGLAREMLAARNKIFSLSRTIA